MDHPTDRIAHTAVVEHWLELEMAQYVREIAQCVHHEGTIWWPITPWADALPRSNLLHSQATSHDYPTVIPKNNRLLCEVNKVIYIDLQCPFHEIDTFHLICSNMWPAYGALLFIFGLGMRWLNLNWSSGADPPVTPQWQSLIHV